MNTVLYLIPFPCGLLHILKMLSKDSLEKLKKKGYKVKLWKDLDTEKDTPSIIKFYCSCCLPQRAGFG